jgi:hypothetical protein
MLINDGATYTTASGQVVDYSHDIRLTDPHRHKYLSAMAEYLDYCDGDDRGFVWVEAEASPRRGCDFCHGIPPSSDGRTQCGWCKDEAYCQWSEDEDG